MKNTLEQVDARLRSRRKIFTGADEDAALLACALAEMGRSAKYVHAKTGLTPGQAYYRLKYLGLVGVRQQWREGTSAAAKEIEAAMLERSEARIYGRLERLREPIHNARFGGVIRPNENKERSRKQKGNVSPKSRKGLRTLQAT